MSPHPSVAAPVPVGTLAVDQPQHDSSQQHARQSATASVPAGGAHQLEAQWEAEPLTAAQTASRLSLLQAEHTQVELELANAVQQADAETADTDMSHVWQQEVAVASAAAAGGTASHDIFKPVPVESVLQQEHRATSCRKSEGQCEASAAQVTQSQPVRPIQSHRSGSRRLTRSSALASCASQSSGYDAVSNAHGGRRGKAQTQAVSNLPVVTEHSEADVAADLAASTAEINDQQALVSQTAVAPAAAKEADPSDSHQQVKPDAAALASVPEEEDWSASPADLPAPLGDKQQSKVSGHDDLHDCDAELAAASQTQAAASAASEEADAQAQHRQSTQHRVREDTSGAVQSIAHDRAAPEVSVTTSADADVAVEATEQFCGRPDSAAEGTNHAAQSQQGQKGRGRIQRPPKSRQPAKKKQNRKRGKMPSGHDENVDVNKMTASQHESVHKMYVAAAEKDSRGGDALDCSASSPVQVLCQQEIGAKGSSLPGKHEGCTKPPR